MKIAIITTNPFYMGGAEKAEIELANTLQKNHSVFLLYTNNIKKPSESYYPISQNVNVIYAKEIANLGKGNIIKRAFRFANKKFFGISNISFLEKIYITKKEIDEFANYINELQFDVVIVSQAKFSIYLGAIKDKVNCYCIGWEHSSFEAYFNTKHQYYWNQHKLFSKYGAKLDACVVLTKEDEKKYCEQLNINAKCIYNMVSIPIIEKQKEAKTIVLWVGRLQEKTKGLDYLVEIAKLVGEENDDCEFWIVGQGQEKEKFQQAIKKKNLINICLFDSTKTIEEFYSKADMLISTSRWEGFGLTLVEAMNYGIPIISFDNSGPHEIIGGSNSGILIEKYNCLKFANSIIELSKNSLKREELGDNGKNRAKDFSLEKIGIQWEQLIGELIG